MAINQKEHQERIKAFLGWFKNCKGSEKGEGQIFFDRLFQAFGNTGVLGSGAVCEKPVKKREGKGIAFADLVWKPRVIIELKKRGTALQKHYDQAFNYWITLVPNRPKYMILCNFDEFWIYDLNTQLHDPVHKLNTKDLHTDWGALKFLLPIEEEPIFDNHNVAITEQVAKTVGEIYLSMVKRGVTKDKAQRFILQLVIALFSEDVELIPQYTLNEILKKCLIDLSAQKELSLLFKAMAVKKSFDKPKKYKHISYFNGGIFKKTTAVELSYNEVELLYDASKQNWEKVRPSIFGSLFEGSMDPKRRHSAGIHYTNELDIYKIVGPSIVQPFQERIKKIKTKKQKRKLLKEIQEFKVLDPACGSGNFLYIAFRELRKLEMEILEDLGEGGQIRHSELGLLVSPKNFYGIDTNKFGLELAKVALSIGRKLLANEFNIQDPSLPFDDLDSNFLSEDALFVKWPKVNAIIGNPPYQSKNKIQKEMGVSYINKIRETYPIVPGRADYCVYWFKKSHDHLLEKGMAGLVGTNTIRQNYSREGSLDYITQNEGIITEAVSSQKWSGEAAVYVSIVNWTKDKSYNKQTKKLFINSENGSELKIHKMKEINSALSVDADVSQAKVLNINKKSKTAYQGQTHGHDSFLLPKKEAEKMISKKPIFKEVLKPFLTAHNFIAGKTSLPQRYVIDFSSKTLIQAQKYKELYKIIEKTVLPKRKEEAEKENIRNKILLKTKPKARVNRHHQNFLKKWWQLSYSRTDLMKKIRKIKRYCVCGQATQRNIFEFVHSDINPNAALVVFAFEDDYSFGILQSSMHWTWFTHKCSTLAETFRYTINTVYDTFPWPQKPTLAQIKKVAKRAKELREVRIKILKNEGISYRDLYRSIELPGDHELLKYHKALDEAVYSAYGFKKTQDKLKFLLSLNLELSAKEDRCEKITGPGLPQNVKNYKELITKDCISL